MDPRDEPLEVATLVSLIDVVRRGWFAGKPQHVLSYARAPSMMETCDAVRHGLARVSVGGGESGGDGGGEGASSFMVVYPDAAALERDLNTKLSTLAPANVVVLNPKHLLVLEEGSVRDWCASMLEETKGRVAPNFDPGLADCPAYEHNGVKVACWMREGSGEKVQIRTSFEQWMSRQLSAGSPAQPTVVLLCADGKGDELQLLNKHQPTSENPLDCIFLDAQVADSMSTVEGRSLTQDSKDGGRSTKRPKTFKKVSEVLSLLAAKCQVQFLMTRENGSNLSARFVASTAAPPASGSASRQRRSRAGTDSFLRGGDFSRTQISPEQRRAEASHLRAVEEAAMLNRDYRCWADGRLDRLKNQFRKWRDEQKKPPDLDEADVRQWLEERGAEDELKQDIRYLCENQSTWLRYLHWGQTSRMSNSSREEYPIETFMEVTRIAWSEFGGVFLGMVLAAAEKVLVGAPPFLRVMDDDAQFLEAVKPVEDMRGVAKTKKWQFDKVGLSRCVKEEA